MMEVVYIQAPVEGSDPRGTDAAGMTLEQWWAHWGDGPMPESEQDLQRWWDRLEDESDWQLCQRYGVGL